MSDLSEWLSLLLRLTHVITAIMWIGQTYLFNWMEKAFEPPRDAKPNIAGELWMVHGGGFYLVEKQKWPESMPRVLHWFKWEAMLTWLSGLALLALMYWAGASLLDYGSELPRWKAVLISAATLGGAVGAYRFIWKTPFGRSEICGGIAWYLLLVAAGGALLRILSDRAAYLHVGAMMGTVMMTNVWLTIIPHQKKIMAISAVNGIPIPALALEAKRCSKHNTLMSIPVLILMLSNHYPSITFGGHHPLLTLAILLPLGACLAHLIRKYAS